MQLIADIILPIFGLIAFGYGATFTKLFDAAAGRALATFVFYFAIPVMLFRTTANNDLPPDLPWAFLLAFYVGGLVVFGIGMATARLIFQAPLERQAIAGLSSSYSNALLMGAPLVLTSLGDAASLPFFLIISFQSAIFFTVVTLLLEIARGRGGNLRDLPLNVARSLWTNPIVMSLLAGIVFNQLGLELPPAVDGWAGLVSGAVAPCALFSMGASLRAYKIVGALSPALVTIGLKLVLHPATVWLLTQTLFTAPPLWAKVAIITAAMPCGVNSYLFATRYGTGEAETATAILLSTAASLVTLGVLLHWLGVGTG